MSLNQVTTLKKLGKLAQARKAVIHSCSYRANGTIVLPAAWVLQFQGSRLLNLMESGLYEYKPKKKQKGKR